MNYLVTGAGSGFGRAIAQRLASEGHYVVAVSRSEGPLASLHAQFPGQIETMAVDLTDFGALSALADKVQGRQLDGILLNAGGPPTMNCLEATTDDWNKAWSLVFLWKAELCRRLVPDMVVRGFGRVVFVESQSVKQPVPGLVLSNAVRSAVVGYARTLAKEVARRGVTVNCMLPGSHATPAIERVVKLRAQEQAISVEEARQQMNDQIPVGRMGTAEEFASLAAWLLGPESSFVTGQLFSHDGGTT